MSDKTRAQKDARVDSILQEHGHVLSELQEHIQAENASNHVSFDELKSMYAHNQSCFEELKLAITSFTGKKTKSARDSAEILGSGTGVTHNVFVNTQSPSMTTVQPHVMETRKPHHAFRVGRVDFPRFNGNDVSSWIFQVEYYFENDGTPEEYKLKLTSIHSEGEDLQWHQGYMRIHSVRLARIRRCPSRSFWG